MSELEYNTLSKRIINAAIEVHKELGAGLLESVYEYCLLDELILLKNGIHRKINGTL